MVSGLGFSGGLGLRVKFFGSGFGSAEVVKAEA